MLAFYREHVGPGRPAEVRERMLEAALANPARARESFAAMCEVAQRFAGWLELGPGIEAALEFVFARWDGRGPPEDVGGEALPLPARLLHVARDYLALPLRGGRATARAPCSSAGPARPTTRASPISRVRHFDEVLRASSTRRGSGSTRSTPSRFPRSVLAGERIDAGFAAFAALTGLKSPWLREHSTSVAELAEAAAWRIGLPAGRRRRSCGARRLPHDLGRLGVSNAIWEKPGPLGFGEWERVRLHAHFTERAFAQSSTLAPIGLLAGSHHERLDGSGYHRGLRGNGARPGGAHPRGRRLLHGHA